MTLMNDCQFCLSTAPLNKHETILNLASIPIAVNCVNNKTSSKHDLLSVWEVMWCLRTKCFIDLVMMYAFYWKMQGPVKVTNWQWLVVAELISELNQSYLKLLEILFSCQVESRTPTCFSDQKGIMEQQSHLSITEQIDWFSLQTIWLEECMKLCLHI